LGAVLAPQSTTAPSIVVCAVAMYKDGAAVIGRSTGPTVDYRSVDRSMRCGYVQRRGRRALRNDGQFSRAHYVS
jgi:hypothetical protein